MSENLNKPYVTLDNVQLRGKIIINTVVFFDLLFKTKNPLHSIQKNQLEPANRNPPYIVLNISMFIVL